MLEVCFLRQVPLNKEDRPFDVDQEVQAFRVQNLVRIRRLDRDDAPHPLAGGFTVESHDDWLRYEEF